MRIAMAQIDPTVADLAGNASLMLQAVDQARTAGAELVVFPEMSLLGYPPRDMVLLPEFIAQAEQVLQERLLPASASIGILVGTVLPGGRYKPHLQNAAVLMDGGKIIHVQAKSLLPTYDVFDEARYFVPAESCVPAIFRGRRLGITICEDLWNDKSFWGDVRYGRDPVAQLTERGAEIVINISASPWHLGKQRERLEMVTARVKACHLPLVYVNQVGGNDDLIFDGASFAINADGQLIARMASFRPDLAVVDISDAAPPVAPFAPEGVDMVYQALVLGIRDYFAKTGHTEAIIGLSGGVDSALVAVLAADALGPDRVTCVSMPSRYSSEHSKSDAAELAANLGVRYESWPIERAFATMLAEFNGGEIARGDLAEENLQARLRGCTLMFFSNRKGSLLLATGNKSELAVGYSTLYGDMCGGLEVIGDVPKTMVYEICRYINSTRPGLIPENILTKAPSAELRPNQKDSDSLPEYELLDPILKAYVEEDRTVAEIAAMGYDEALVRRVITMVERAEYKRRQAPPILRVTSRHFGSGRRMPIAKRWTV